ncbi:MAG: response regulator [bacterium]
MFENQIYRQYAALSADGVEALEKINSDEELSLVLCDINMPLKSGMDLLRETQTLRKERSLPMVMLTTEGKSQMVQEAKALGASGW